MSPMPGSGPVDSKRVGDILSDLNAFTGHSVFSPEKREREIDERIEKAGLSLAEKVEVFRRLAPRAEDSRFGSHTDERKELRMERLLLSVAPDDLPAFKFALEYDGDYKDLEEYVFHDIDDEPRQRRILEHLRRTPSPKGVKVLSDVDDTMYANLIDARYPKKTLYPGVLDFYEAVKDEPFGDLPGIPITTLSARPNPVAGALEEVSLENLVKFTGGRLCPSALSGALVSSTLGTVETVLRAELELPSDETPHGQEDQIGRVKFDNFVRFSALYPEYRYVFVGDSGQADALTASLMVSAGSPEGAARVVTTFIHDLRESEHHRSASPSFRGLARDLVVGRTSASGRGVIVFRNYIEAALIAHRHSATLQQLITAEKLARITRAALQDFQKIAFGGSDASRKRLVEQYRQDAEEAFAALTTATPRPPSLEATAAEIRRILDGGF